MHPFARASRSAARLHRSILLAGLAWLLLALANAAVLPALAAESTSDPHIDVLTATGTVDNVMATYVEQGVSAAAEGGATAVILTLNTPGGALDSTQRIVSSLLEARVPTIVWVAPSGGRAASAGTFITLASHVALMAPGTNIGAASPVGAGGEDIPGTLGQKVKNDAIANIRSIAETRGRNADWAASAVDQARSSAASEAVALHVVDGIAASIEEVLAKASGRTVKVAGEDVPLALTSAPVEELPMNPFQSFIHLLSDGNVAALLFTLGSLGLLIELIHPNFVTGILGGLAIILAFIGFGSLPLNVGGLLLIALAMLLFVLELNVTSHGLLAIGGVVCLFLGASALYTAPGNPVAPDVHVAPTLAIAMAVLAGGLMAVAVTTVIRARLHARALEAAASPGGRRTVPAGTDGLTRTLVDERGIVRAAGEDWTARSADGQPIPEQTIIRVVRQEGLTLVVEPRSTTAAEARA